MHLVLAIWVILLAHTYPQIFCAPSTNNRKRCTHGKRLRCSWYANHSPGRCRRSHPPGHRRQVPQRILSQWDALGISWDLYTTTGTEHHAEVTQEMFLAQLNNGHIDRRTTTQLYDPKAKRFLPDRYVEGVCPHCGYEEARGDQCDDCGKTYDAVELITHDQNFQMPFRNPEKQNISISNIQTSITT